MLNKLVVVLRVCLAVLALLSGGAALGQVICSTSLSVSPASPAPAGTTFTLSASGAPATAVFSGSMTFFRDGVSIGTGTLISPSTTATITDTPAPGTYAYTAQVSAPSCPVGAGSPLSTPVTVVVQAAAVVPPTASNISVSVPANSPANTIPASVAGSVTSIAASTPTGAGGTVSVAGTNMLYTPATNFVGTDTFTYTATGPNGTSNVATVTVTVVAGPPVANGATLTVPYGTAGTIDLAPFISGPQLTGLSIAITQPPSSGNASVVGTHISYQPNAGFVGTDSLRYVATSVSGTSNAAVLQIVVQQRPNPAESSGVRAIRDAGAATLRHLQSAQVDNISGRLMELQGDAQEGTGRLATGRSSACGYGVWAGGVSGFGTLGNSSGFKFDTRGVTLGGDRCVGETAMAGVALGYGRERSQALGDGSTSGGSASTVTGYGSFRLSGLRLAWMAGVGQVQTHYDRYLPEAGSYAHGQWSGTHWSSSATASYDWRRGNLRLTPYSRADLSTVQVDAYTESGGGPLALRFAGQRMNTSKATLGFNGEYTYATDWGKAVPRLRMEYQKDFARREQTSLAYADTANGPNYVLTADDLERRQLMVSAGADFYTRVGLSFGLNFTHTRSNGGYGSNAGLLRMSQKF
jgi:uncharacterized protein with beta-barrel porin domain